MADGTQVLREYLLSLGFKINTTEGRKFDQALEKTQKLAIGTGAALVGVGTAAVAMVQSFTNQMEKLYYTSRRTGSTVENLQALQYSAKQIGISGDQIQGAITGMARSLRANPGLVGLLKNLGVRVEGRDTSDVMKDMVRQLRQMPFYIGSKFASMFGMDEDTFLLMSQNLEKMDRAAQMRKDMNADAGVDAEKAAEAAVQWSNALDEVKGRATVLRDTLAVALLPTMREFGGVANEFLKDMASVAQKSNGLWDLLTRLSKKFAGREDVPELPDAPRATGNGFLNDEAQVTLRNWRHTLVGFGHPAGYALKKIGTQYAGYKGRSTMSNFGPSGASAGTGGGEGSEALFARLEAQYGLPSGILAALRAAESGGNDRAVSGAGAQGPFQFMPATSKEYGVGDPFSLADEAPAAAKKIAHLIAMYGDLEQAVAAWNYGEGNFARAGNRLGASPAETQAFVPRVLGGMSQHNTFHITGSGTNEIGQAVGDQLGRNNAQFFDNLQSVAQ